MCEKNYVYRNSGQIWDFKIKRVGTARNENQLIRRLVAVRRISLEFDVCFGPWDHPLVACPYLEAKHLEMFYFKAEKSTDQGQFRVTQKSLEQ
ncbi:unnamed protein product [Allacma fusca]|uniref:Uncharacterized protein n=1 Tax=Allacma fusca TaxID=39272 RepID=A0A8J2NI32_9HEXA|nr:unnamed protein product [Allacma fusca]